MKGTQMHADALRPVGAHAACLGSEDDQTGGCPPCWYCGQPSETTDHILPKCRGGTNHTANLLDACRSCNSSKGKMTPKEWREVKELRAAMEGALHLKWTVPQLRWLRDNGFIETKRHVFWGERK